MQSFTLTLAGRQIPQTRGSSPAEHRYGSSNSVDSGVSWRRLAVAATTHLQTRLEFDNWEKTPRVKPLSDVRWNQREVVATALKVRYGGWTRVCSTVAC